MDTVDGRRVTLSTSGRLEVSDNNDDDDDDDDKHNDFTTAAAKLLRTNERALGRRDSIHDEQQR